MRSHSVLLNIDYRVSMYYLNTDVLSRTIRHLNKIDYQTTLQD